MSRSRARTSRLALPNLLVAALGVLAGSLLLTACSGKEENLQPSARDLTPVSVALDWYANPDHAGLLVTDSQGYFDSAGLDVSLDEPTDPSLPLKLVAAGEVDIAVSYQPEVLLARESGSDVVAIAALVDRPLTSLIWLAKSKIRGVSDLRGKTISTAGLPYQKAYLETILDRAGLSTNAVKTVTVGTALTPSILSGRADATLGPFWNIEGVDLEMSGKKPVIKPVDRLGIPTYDELVLVARADRIERDPTPFCLFLSALARGTGEAIDRPNLALDSVVEANPALGRDREVTRRQVEKTLPLLGGEDRIGGFGAMSRTAWQRFINWSFERGVLKASQSAVDATTNTLLPGRCLEG